MRLLVIRHGVAADKEAFAATGKDDALRPLTKRGARVMNAAARGLAGIAPEIDLLATSPLVRARQTARIVARAYGIDDVAESESLEPAATPNAFLRWLRAHEADTVAVVGHEPHLGMLVTWLLFDQMDARLVLKKGGACLLEFAARPAAGSARLHWLLTSGQLQRLADD